MDEYISRDELIKFINENGLVYASTLKTFPAADVRPVARGRWSWCTGNKYRCTNCGRNTNVDEVMEKPVYNYCPYCGADMRGDADEDK